MSCPSVTRKTVTNSNTDDPRYHRSHSLTTLLLNGLVQAEWEIEIIVGKRFRSKQRDRYVLIN